MVSGGLAVMKHLFRDQLANEELVSRLFVTADNTGIYADRDIYGNGRMDLGAATSPVGVLDVPIDTGLAAMAHASLNSTGLRFGAAFGDGFGEAFGDGELMALDDYGAPFWYGLDNFAATTDGPAMSARLRTFLGPGSTPGLAVASASGGGSGASAGTLGMTAGLLRMPTAAGNGHLALAEGAVMVSAFEAGGLSATAFTTGPLRPFMPATGAALGWRPDGLPVGFTAGWISERETMLGSMGLGAFGNLSAGTAFFGFDGGLDLGSWRFGANGEFGVVNPAAQGGMIQEISALATSTFAVHASRAFESAGALHFLAVAAAPGGKRLGVPHGAECPDQAGRSAPPVAPRRPRAGGAPARCRGAVEPGAAARGTPPGRPLESLAGAPGRTRPAARAARGMAMDLLRGAVPPACAQ